MLGEEALGRTQMDDRRPPLSAHLHVVRVQNGRARASIQGARILASMCDVRCFSCPRSDSRHVVCQPATYYQAPPPLAVPTAKHMPKDVCGSQAGGSRGVSAVGPWRRWGLLSPCRPWPRSFHLDPDQLAVIDHGAAPRTHQRVEAGPAQHSRTPACLVPDAWPRAQEAGQVSL